MDNKNSLISNVNEILGKYGDKISIILQPQGMFFYYKDLKKDSDLICQELSKLGIQDQYIGISNDLNIPIVTLIVGILKANLSFVFLNDENDLLINKLKIKWILTSSDVEFKINHFQCILSIKLKFWKVVIWKNLQNNHHFLKDPNIAYAIKTSGSTGNPKVVQVTYNSIVPNIFDLKSKLKITTGDVIALASPLTFDPSIVEIFLSLLSGARLLIISPSFIHCTLEHLFPIDRLNSLTFLQITPSVFNSLPLNIRSLILGSNSSVRSLIFGGEPFPNTELLNNLKHPENNTLIYNIYGITEISCWASLGLCDLNKNPICLGKPLSDTEFVICDEKGNEVLEKNCKGELWIKSNKRLCIIDEEYFDLSSQTILQQTGDIIEKLGGLYYYVCRKDDIIKRFGHRVNLMTIKQVATSYSDVENAECVWNSEQRFLSLYVTPDKVNVEYIRNKLNTDLLPSHRPDEIYSLSKLPLSTHGKVSKKELQSNLVVTFKKLCEKHLRNHLDWNLSFSACGGDSILSLQIIQEMRNPPTELLTKLLSNNSLLNCKKYIENSVQEEYIDKKRTKNDIPVSKIELEIIWKFNLEKCIDATPAVYKNNDSSYVLIIGAHSHKLGILTCDSESLNNTNVICLDDRIEATACFSKCGQYCFIGCYDSYMYCISIKTGKIFWKFKTQGIIKSKGVLTSSGEYLLFGSYDHNIYCLKALTGILEWKIKQGSLFASICLIDCNNSAISASLDGTVINFDQSNGKINWKKHLTTPVFSTPSHIFTLVIIAQVNGEVIALDIYNAEMIWKFKASNNIFSSLTIFEDFVIFGCHDHSVYCLQSSNGTLQWQIKLDSPIFATPYIYTSADSSPYIVTASTKGYIYILDFVQSCILSSYKIDGELFSSPIVFSNKIFIGSRDDHIYCLKIN